MPKKRHTPEEIVAKLRQVDVLTSQGKPMGERPNHVWAYDSVEDRTHDQRKFRMLTVVDEFTREALAIRVDRRLNSAAVIETLAELMLERGIPGHIRSDNVLCREARRQGGAGLDRRGRCADPDIAPGSPWENGYVESFNAKLRDELLDGGIFYSLKEAQILIEAWRRHYNAVRPHSALRWTPPAPEVHVPTTTRAWPPSPLGSRSAPNYH